MYFPLSDGNRGVGPQIEYNLAVRPVSLTKGCAVVQTNRHLKVQVLSRCVSGQDTNEIKRWRNSLFQAISSLFFAMEPTEDSNESVGYKSDDVPLILLVTPNVINYKRRKTLGGGAPSDPVSLNLGTAHLDTSDLKLNDEGSDDDENLK
jgi:hypothetical protein